MDRIIADVVFLSSDLPHLSVFLTSGGPGCVCVSVSVRGRVRSPVLRA